MAYKIKQPKEYPVRLPIYKIKGKFYFLDKRLNEYRNIDKPYQTIKMEDVSLEDLQTPTKRDGIKLLGH
jgi:hypothetical protein